MRAFCAVLLALICVTVPATAQRQTCEPGFLWNAQIETCMDINECLVSNGGCDSRTRCYNTPGSRVCGECPPGNYVGDGYKGCIDVDECAPGNEKCDARTDCSNFDGGYSCTKCPEGFQGSGKQGCKDVDECSLAVAACSPKVKCKNFVPDCGTDLKSRPLKCGRGFECDPCPKGYRGDGYGPSGCIDINECEFDAETGLKPAPNPCGIRQCQNLPSEQKGRDANGNEVMGFNCVGFEACSVGLIRNNATGKCDDINECLTNPCPPKTDCINLIGGDPGYKCSDCPTGYEKDATGVCVDINECLKNNGGCDPRAECTNKEPGFECGPVVEGPCDAGFARATMNSPCRDVNECLTNNGGCHRTTDCINTEGSFYCTPCPNGTLGTGLTAEGCVDINECADYSTNNGDCDVRVVCTNVVCTAPGVDCRKQRGRTCGDCPAGFTGNGYDGCNDINECSLQPNGGCPADKPCFNEIGGSPGFRCGDCPDNTREDPKTRECVDIDECKEPADSKFAANCHYLSSCINLISNPNPDGTYSQGYMCNGCPEGYSGAGYGGEANSTGCVDIDECALDKTICGTGICVNKEPGYQCIEKDKCPPGFKLVGTGINKRCVDIDECVEGINLEDPNQPLCPPGNKQCDPKNGGCDLNVQCYNAQGTRYCGSCPTGFMGGNETRPSQLNPTGRIVGSLPDYLPEYESCQDINECDPCDGTGDPNCPLATLLPKNGGCNELQACVNAIGYNFCGDCADGYKEHPILGCQDINECAEGTDLCNDLAACVNIRGTYACQACAPGFRFSDMGDDSRNILGLGLDGCTDVDECAQQIDACDRRQAPGQPAGTPMQTCVNTWGSYLCLAWNDTKCAEAQGPTAKIKPSQVTLSDEPNRVQTVNADATTPGDSGILSYFWSFNKTKTEGKSAPKLRATTSQSAFVSNIGKKGQYVFQVLVTDMCGKTSTDQVTLVKENDDAGATEAPTSATGSPVVPVAPTAVPLAPGATASPNTPGGGSTPESPASETPTEPLALPSTEAPKLWNIRTPPPSPPPSQILIAGAGNVQASACMLVFVALVCARHML